MENLGNKRLTINIIEDNGKIIVLYIRSCYSKMIMKKSLYSLLIFFSVVIAGTFIGSLFFMLYGNLTSLIASQSDSFFSYKLFVPGLIVSFPLVCILGLLLLVYFEIRHPTSSVWPKVTYIGLGILTWCVFIPFGISKSVKYVENRFVVEDSQTPLTKGLFRKSENGIEYLSSVSKDGLADGIFIDQTGKISFFYDKDVKVHVKDLFADSLIRDGASLSPFVSVPLGIYAELMVNGTNCWMKGYVSWLCFAFMGFALLAVTNLRQLSSWKLLNAFIIVIAGVIVAMINYVYYCGEFFNGFAVEWARIFEGLPVDNPLMVAINLLLIAVFIGVRFIGRVTKKTEEEEMVEEDLE